MQIGPNLDPGGNLPVRDFIRQNCDQYLQMGFKELKQTISDKCLFPSSEKEENQLKNWLKDERRRLKKSSTAKNFEEQKFLKNQDTKEQADQIFVEQEDRILSGILTLDGRKKDDFLRLQIDENFLLLLQFLKSRNNAPNEDFLPRLLNLCQEMKQSHKQTLLFLRICALQQREILNVNSALIEATLVELANGAVDQDGAYGLLKISFQNDIPFNSFALDSLIAFQDRYPLQFKRFFNSLNDKIDSQVLKCVPATCFLFTKPFFLELKNQGKDLHKNMDYQYLPSIVKLLAYSFESEHEAFQQLLQLFKEGCLNIFGKGFDLTKLLDSITEQEILRNQLFFGSLKNQCKILEQTFKLIADKKIISVDSQLVDKLLTMEKKSYLETEQAPMVMGDFADNEKKYQQYLLLFKQRNNLPELENIEIDLQLGQDVVQLMEYFKIQRLSYIQRAAMVTISHFFEHSSNKMSLKFETGAGKTTLALLLILQIGLKKVKSFMVNHSFDLCFRDYNKLVPIAQQLGLKVSYIVKLDDLAVGQNSDIFFVQSDIYCEMAKINDWKTLIVDSFILLDEFDETVFAQGTTIEKLFAFGMSKWFVSVTGSSLDQIHTQIIQKGLRSIVLDFPPAQQIDGRENICLGSIIFQTRKEQLNHVASVCKEQAIKTPVLLIIEKEGHKSFLDVAKSLPIKDLNILNPKEVESFLKSSFLKKVNDSYYICLLNESQGRGLDAPTNFDIEANGGISTIIAKTPNSQQEFVTKDNISCSYGRREQKKVVIASQTIILELQRTQNQYDSTTF